MVGVNSYCWITSEYCGMLWDYLFAAQHVILWTRIEQLTSPIPCIGTSSYTQVILISSPLDRKREWNSSCILASTSESLRRTSTNRGFVPDTKPASRESRCPTTARPVPECGVPRKSMPRVHLRIC